MACDAVDTLDRWDVQSATYSWGAAAACTCDALSSGTGAGTGVGAVEGVGIAVLRRDDESCVRSVDCSSAGMGGGASDK